MAVSVDISPTGRRIAVYFRYNKKALAATKRIPGARFVPADRGGPYWTVPKDIPTCRRLREEFGDSLRIDKPLKRWAKREIGLQTKLTDLALAKDADLTRLPSVLPKMVAKLRHYQRAGIVFGAASPHPLFADPPRLGKTWMSIGTVFEAGIDNGPHLVIPPMTTMETVWLRELNALQPHQVFVAQGSKTRRKQIVKEFLETVDDFEEPAWLIVNPAMISYRSVFDTCENHFSDEPVRVLRRCEWCDETRVAEYSELFDVEWNSIIVDECNRNGIRNPNTATGEAVRDLHVAAHGKRMMLTGTPMGGKALNLFNILQWLRPDVFTSKWNWAGQWLKIEENGYGKQIGDIIPDREQEMIKSLAPYILRREKAEVRPELPPVEEPIDMWCEMTIKQAGQYVKFAADAEIRIEEEDLSATSILAEYTRLKQFADAFQTIKDGKLTPLPESGKLEVLLDILDERGMLDGSNEQIVIFSQFTQVVNMIVGWLTKHKIPTLKITGAVKGKDRAQAQDDFQAGKVKAMVMQTITGGVGITLDRADTCVFMDETWDPDEQEQAWNRIDPVTHMNMKTVIFLRSKGTIEEYIQGVNMDKDTLNKKVLRGIRVR